MIRVVTWTLGGSPTTGAVGVVLRRLEPDVLLLADLPGRLGLRRCLAGTGLSTVSQHGRGRAGSAIAVSERVRHLTSSAVVLDGGGASEQRTASHAILGAGGRTLSVLSFRLVGGPEARVADAARVAGHLDRIDHPAVAGGDLGEGPGGPAGAMLLGERLDAWTVGGVGTGLTYPTPDPVARHDAVFVHAGVAVDTAHVETAAPVDLAARHRPVAVDLRDLAG